jgi:hypothetical protein
MLPDVLRLPAFRVRVPRPSPLAAWVFTACLATGCGPGPRDGGFDSPNPAARLYAVDRSVREWRAERTGESRPEVPEATRRGLVECLSSDDPLLRMNAILALEEMTGSTRGYRFDDSAAERQIAIERWADWTRDGDATATTGKKVTP